MFWDSENLSTYETISLFLNITNIVILLIIFMINAVIFSKIILFPDNDKSNVKNNKRNKNNHNGRRGKSGRSGDPTTTDRRSTTFSLPTGPGRRGRHPSPSASEDLGIDGRESWSSGSIQGQATPLYQNINREGPPEATVAQEAQAASRHPRETFTTA